MITQVGLFKQQTLNENGEKRADGEFKPVFEQEVIDVVGDCSACERFRFFFFQH